MLPGDDVGKDGIHFAQTADGVSIAYAVSGTGYPLVKAANWLTPIEADYLSPVWKPWIDAFAGRHRLIRYDPRGTGLSDRDSQDASLAAFVDDFAAVADAAGCQRFAILGIGQGAAVGIDYAARHPHRVSHLLLLGGYARGALRRCESSKTRELMEIMLKLVETGWGERNPAFHQFFATHIVPNATPEQLSSIIEMQRISTSSQHATDMIRSWNDYDASDALANVRCPTLVMHCRGDARVPIEEAKYIAASIPDARLELLDSDNHIPLAQEPAFGQMMERFERFLAENETGCCSTLSTDFAGLTPRELTILEGVARGHDNRTIAAHLGIADKTVRNNLSLIYDKLGVRTRAQAIVNARNAGIGV